MAWDWSYSADGERCIYRGIEALDARTRRIVYAEWQSYFCWRAAAERDSRHEQYDDLCSEHRVVEDSQVIGVAPFADDFDQVAYERELDALAESEFAEHVESDIFCWAKERGTCSNGGHEAWICPYGCHTVELAAFAMDVDPARSPVDQAYLAVRAELPKGLLQRVLLARSLEPVKDVLAPLPVAESEWPRVLELARPVIRRAVMSYVEEFCNTLKKGDL